MKHLPLTIVGPVNATRPVLVLVGAIFIFGERLNLLQWAGVLLAIGALILKEKNLKSKAQDLGLLLISMVLLYLGSR